MTDMTAADWLRAALPQLTAERARDLAWAHVTLAEHYAAVGMSVEAGRQTTEARIWTARARKLEGDDG